MASTGGRARGRVWPGPEMCPEWGSFGILGPGMAAEDSDLTRIGGSVADLCGAVNFRGAAGRVRPDRRGTPNIGFVVRLRI